MRPTFHTRSTATVPAILAAIVLTTGCAGGGPLYELQPTEAPLRYMLSSEGGNDIDTPAGTQGATHSSEATMTLQVGEAVENGTAFTVTIESMVLETGGDFGSNMIDLSADVVGKPFRGWMTRDGELTFTETPDIERDSLSLADLQRMVSALLFPLPPGGDMAVGSWTHRVTLPMGGGLEGESVYDGSIAVAGDTVWNGIQATVFVSEGVLHVKGSGQPQGAPSEIEMVYDVETRTLYIWDYERGVLLAVGGSGEGGGEMSTMGFSMPMAVFSELDIQLVP